MPTASPRPTSSRHPVPRRLARLRGRIDDLLTDPRHRDAEEAWVQVILTDPVRPGQAKPRLERRFPHTLSLGFEPEGGISSRLPAARLGAGVSDHQVSLDFVADVRGRPADEAESALLLEACDACGHDREADPHVRSGSGLETSVP